MCISLELCSVDNNRSTASTHWTNFGERYRRTGRAQDMEDVRVSREQKPQDPVCSLITALAHKFLHALLKSERILKGADVGDAEKWWPSNSLATRATNDDKQSIINKVMLRIQQPMLSYVPNKASSSVKTLGNFGGLFQEKMRILWRRNVVNGRSSETF